MWQHSEKDFSLKLQRLSRSLNLKKKHLLQRIKIWKRKRFQRLCLGEVKNCKLEKPPLPIFQRDTRRKCEICTKRAQDRNPKSLKLGIDVLFTSLQFVSLIVMILICVKFVITILQKKAKKKDLMYPNKYNESEHRIYISELSGSRSFRIQIFSSR